MEDEMKTISDLIVRRFTKELEDSPGKTVYDLFEWKTVDVLIKDYARNKVVCDMKGLEFPVHYSQNACDIIAAHYFRKAGVSNEAGYERSMREVVHRMVEFWTSALLDEGLLDDEDQKQILYDELAYLLLSQAWAPNSPQWFNTGLVLCSMYIFSFFCNIGIIVHQFIQLNCSLMGTLGHVVQNFKVIGFFALSEFHMLTSFIFICKKLIKKLP
jgi:hypothetical protein